MPSVNTENWQLPKKLLPIDFGWHLPNIEVMSIEELILRIDALAEKTGLRHSTICQNAFKNPLVYDRLIKRKSYDAGLGERLGVYEKSIAKKQTGAAQ